MRMFEKVDPTCINRDITAEQKHKCSLHFKKAFFKNNNKRMLTRGYRRIAGTTNYKL